jgi:glycosyltransferase involved in cell wall biosynthesis
MRVDQEGQIKNRMRDACIRQASKFSWDIAASKTADLYDKILSS